jgi:hypothetical protein
VARHFEQKFQRIENRRIIVNDRYAAMIFDFCSSLPSYPGQTPMEQQLYEAHVVGAMIQVN